MKSGLRAEKSQQVRYCQKGVSYVRGISCTRPHLFRGRDFQTQKAPGVIRVVTLGASSTFGYYDRDEETYPFLLETLLNAESPESLRFEVINLGIPHLKMASIYQLFMAEALPLQPDIVTFYEGNNDAGSISSPPYFGPKSSGDRLRSAVDWARTV